MTMGFFLPLRTPLESRPSPAAGSPPSESRTADPSKRDDTIAIRMTMVI